MVDYMFDTNGLVKYYHTEIGSAKVQQIVAGSGNRIFISELSIIELISSLSKKVRMGDIALPAFRAARRRFFADITKRKLHVIMLTQKHGRMAIKLLLY